MTAIIVGIMAAAGRHSSGTVVKSYILIDKHEADGAEREEREN